MGKTSCHLLALSTTTTGRERESQVKTGKRATRREIKDMRFMIKIKSPVKSVAFETI